MTGNGLPPAGEAEQGTSARLTRARILAQCRVGGVGLIDLSDCTVGGDGASGLGRRLRKLLHPAALRWYQFSARQIRELARPVVRRDPEPDPTHVVRDGRDLGVDCGTEAVIERIVAKLSTCSEEEFRRLAHQVPDELCDEVYARVVRS